MPKHQCRECLRNIPCRTEGPPNKQTIWIQAPWNKEPITVRFKGEPCLPCPRCELEEGQEDISNWERPNERLHKRLRQHYLQKHHHRLNHELTPTQVTNFYAKAWELRCQIIHGPLSRNITAEKHVPLQSTSRFSAGQKPRVLSNKSSTWVQLPEGYVNWLGKEMRAASLPTYLGMVKTYLAWIKDSKQTDPALIDVWQYEWVASFIESLKETTAPTTAFNYLCGLMAAQRFTELHGESHPTDRVRLQFQALLRNLGKGKAAHRHIVAKQKKNSAVKLHDVNRRILQNPDLAERYQDIVQSVRLSAKKNLTSSDIAWATGYAILNLQASNFKRNGNIAKISFEHAMKRIKTALRKQKPCEIEVQDATKTGGNEIFCVITKKRIKVLLEYGTVIRPASRPLPDVTSFFVTSQGNRVKKVNALIQHVGKTVGLPRLTIKDLRSRIETEAALISDDTSRKDIAGHLAHTEATRDRHYLLADKRRSRKAAAMVDKLVREAQPPVTSEEESADERESYSETKSESTQSSVQSTDSAEIDSASLNEKRSHSPVSSTHSSPKIKFQFSPSPIRSPTGLSNSPSENSSSPASRKSEPQVSSQDSPASTKSESSHNTSFQSPIAGSPISSEASVPTSEEPKSSCNTSLESPIEGSPNSSEASIPISEEPKSSEDSTYKGSSPSSTISTSENSEKHSPSRSPSPAIRTLRSRNIVVSRSNRTR